MLDLVTTICLWVLALSLGLTLFRLLRGPTVTDRIISLDLTAVLVVASVGVYCVKFNNAAYLDAAVVLAIITFISTVAFARYLERRYQKK